MEQFKEFLERIEPFLRKYEVGIRINVNDAQEMQLVVSPIPRDKKEKHLNPVVYRGTIEELAAKLADPVSGLEEVGRQAASVALTWEDDARKEDKPAKKTATKKAATKKGDKKTDDSSAKGPEKEPEKKPNGQTSLLDEEPEKKEEEKKPEPPSPEPPAPEPSKEEEKQPEKKEQEAPKGSEGLERHLKLVKSIEDELKSLAPDFTEIDKDWAKVIANFESMTSEEQAEHRLPGRELKNRINAEFEKTYPNKAHQNL